METYDLSKLTAADFQACLNRDILIHFSEADTVTGQIVKVTELNSYTPLERGAFSVVVQTTGDAGYRAQGVYQIDLPSFRNLAVFLVPMGPDKDGMHYEAVFS